MDKVHDYVHDKILPPELLRLLPHALENALRPEGGVVKVITQALEVDERTAHGALHIEEGGESKNHISSENMLRTKSP